VAAREGCFAEFAAFAAPNVPIVANDHDVHPAIHLPRYRCEIGREWIGRPPGKGHTYTESRPPLVRGTEHRAIGYHIVTEDMPRVASVRPLPSSQGRPKRASDFGPRWTIPKNSNCPIYGTGTSYRHPGRPATKAA
jgi:hypothetical protein